MNFIPNNLYHVYNQGNNQQIIFTCQDDYLIFLREVRMLILPHTEIIAYCLMPNHFHFLIYIDERVNRQIKQGNLIIDPITNGIRKLLSGYARIHNERYNRSGSLFRQKTKSNCLSEMFVPEFPDYSNLDYCFNCFQYIHQNPLRAGLIDRMENWEFSSFRDYAGLRNGTLCNKELAAKYCLYEPNNFLKRSYQIIDDNLGKHFL